MRNYWNYFTEVEERFCRRRGTAMLLSTLDWALIDLWREAGIPLEAALTGIDSTFDKYEARPVRRGAQRINGLAWCAQAVLEAAEQMREASAGSAPAPAETRESGFEGERVAAHLETAAEALLRSPLAPEACSRTARRLQELALEARGAREGGEGRDGGGGSGHAALDLEALDRVLTVLEEKLFAALTAAAPEELLVAFKEQARDELAPYRRRMSAVQLKQVEQQFVTKQLLAHYDLPRLSLFYMSQG